MHVTAPDAGPRHCQPIAIQSTPVPSKPGLTRNAGIALAAQLPRRAPPPRVDVPAALGHSE